MCTNAFAIWRKENADKLKEASKDGSDVALLRVGEISVATPEEAIRLCNHHTQQVAVDLNSWKSTFTGAPDMDQDGYEQRGRIGKLRDLPKYFRARLDPIFSRPDMFDPQGRYKKRFAAWERAYLDRLDKIDYWHTGKESVAHRYQKYISTFNDRIDTVGSIVNDIIDDLGVKVSL